MLRRETSTESPPMFHLWSFGGLFVYPLRVWINTSPRGPPLYAPVNGKGLLLWPVLP